MSRKHKKTIAIPRKIYPKTNISRAYYKQVINSIEHAPLVKHSTLTIASMIIAICVLMGTIIWYAQFNPGNLIQTSGKVTNISSGKTDTLGSSTTFVTFEFNTKDNQEKTVRQSATPGQSYDTGETIRIGYHPNNPNYARILDKTSLPPITVTLWVVPLLIMIWFILVALMRYIKRQEIIWEAAEAADVD